MWLLIIIVINGNFTDPVAMTSQLVTERQCRAVLDSTPMFQGMVRAVSMRCISPDGKVLEP